MPMASIDLFRVSSRTVDALELACPMFDLICFRISDEGLESKRLDAFGTAGLFGRLVKPPLLGTSSKVNLLRTRPDPHSLDVASITSSPTNRRNK